MTESAIKKEAIKVLNDKFHKYWFPPKVKFYPNDIFGVFDFVSISPASEIYFVQLTTLSHVSHRRRKILEFFGANHVRVPNSYIWAWDKSVGFFRVLEM